MVKSNTRFCPQIASKRPFHRLGLNEVLLVGSEVVFDLWIGVVTDKIIKLVDFGFDSEQRSGFEDLLLSDFVDDGEVEPIKPHY